MHLYIERGSPKAEPAARRWLVRYLSEGSPSLRDVAKVTASLAEARSRRAAAGPPELTRLRPVRPAARTYRDALVSPALGSRRSAQPAHPCKQVGPARTRRHCARDLTGGMSLSRSLSVMRTE